jgi:HK97 family phage portal protein
LFERVTVGLLTDKIRDMLRLPGVAGSGPVQFVDTRGLFEDYVMGLSAEDLYRTQPHLRTVVEFRARNIAQLGVHFFERVSDTDRRRNRDSAAAQLFRRPNQEMTGYDLLFRLVADLGLYDDAYWILEEDLSMESGWRLQPVPPTWVTALTGGSVWGPDTMHVLAPGAAQATPVPMSKVIRFHGWDPTNLNRGSSPVNALKAVLMEQVHAVKYRDQLWSRAGRVGITVTRPTMTSGTNWTAEQKKQFKEVLDSKLAGDGGADAGGSIILEDGMTLDRIGFSAHEEEFIEAAKLSLATVAQVYHVNPVMVGMLDNANFSNAKEFARSLYTNTLGPIMAMIEDRINTTLIPRVSRETALYAEFNIAEKLQGSFEEQAAVMQTATGRPWQTVNEARARFNLPEIEGGDALSIPLNILLGGPGGDPAAAGTGTVGTEVEAAKAGLSPDDIAKLVTAAGALIRSGFAPEAALAAVGLDPIEHLGLLPTTVQKPVDPTDGTVDETIQDALKAAYADLAKALEEAKFKTLPEIVAPRVADSKGRAPSTYEANVKRVLQGHFGRQRKAVTAALGAKAGTDWWDRERWDRELAEDLFKLAALTATKLGQEAAAELGFNPDDYDQDRTLKFLKAVTQSRAEAINLATFNALEAALAGAEDPVKAAEPVFTKAEEQRSGAAAAAMVTMFSAFGTTEAAKQLGGGQATKTWLVNSKDPRAEHAKMNGETVGIEEKFSNGADYPGDSVLGADGVAGCRCSVEITIN